MFSELVNSIKANLYDRIVSPLSGAFLIALALTNYQTILLIFDDQNYYLKITYLEQYLYPGFIVGFLKLFLIPFVSACIFIVIYPFPSRIAYGYWLNQQRKLKTLKVYVENETPLTIQESRKLRQQLAVLEKEFNTELVEKDREIEELKKLVAENSSSSSYEKGKEQHGYSVGADYVSPYRIVNKEGEIEEVGESDLLNNAAAVSLLENLAHDSGGLTEQRLVDVTNLSAVRIEYLIDKLVRLGFVETRFRPDGTPLYALSSDGKKYVLSNDIA
ncbi:hypothetical protein A6779_09900 [Marinobacter adhaerens]|uniref:winged helix DNA-binding protein n=1 Tax=Marinobacter adhaerens TaxID=1033846 RepID=UPI000840ACEA|nr:winged helix DNA-binding protein [Marinobacter adhaerens]ODM32417.1 hypothetical protein A6779_09900 [Marinobacter adhaerens]